ncbi:MAG: nucleoside hydrolase [Candidatus Pacebacteria bacterium]|nr:nucleoside hydrolase [Candidatus Paceibacterota bacterium]
MQNKKIIIDTDPGVDDALAISFAIKASLPIEAITTVYGNSTVSNCTTNALSILELTGSNIPVYSGVDKPLKGKSELANSHGDNGLGGFNLKTNKKISKLSALEYYQEILNNSEDKSITIIAIGPTTNIGQLIKESPKLFNKVDRIIIMGGVFCEEGNVTPYAEFNVYNDPYSLDLILKSNLPEIIIIPANICRQVTFTKDIFNKINNPKLSKGLAKISKMFIDYYSNDPQYGGFKGGVMYDLLTTVLLVNPKLFTLEKRKITVETKDKEKFGLTRIVKGVPNCKVVTEVKVEELKKLYIKIMNK